MRDRDEACERNVGGSIVRKSRSSADFPGECSLTCRNRPTADLVSRSDRRSSSSIGDEIIIDG